MSEPKHARALPGARLAAVAGLVVAALVVVGVVAATRSGPEPPTPAPSDRPNIVLILTDDQRWDTLWAMPNVQRLLVDRGVTFTNGFVSNPLCCPSRAAILTGKYSHGTGIYTNFAPDGGYAGFDPSVTIATILRARGYSTALVGKYFNGYLETAVPVGWDRWAAFDGPNGGVAYYDYTMSIDGERRSYGSDPEDYSTIVAANHAVSFIERARRPFFLYFAPSAAHLPAIPGPGDEDAFPSLEPARPASFGEPDTSDKPAWVREIPPFDRDMQGRADRQRAAAVGSLPAVDDAVRRIVDALGSTHVLDQTLILFMSDNGFLHGEHRLLGKHAPYEESIRVPMVLRYDPIGMAGVEDPRVVANIDVAPTFADLAGTKMPDADGTSLLRLLDDRTDRGRRWLLLENLGVARNPEHFEGSIDRLVPTYCGLRGRRWKYVYYADGSEELYDLRRDPHELRNAVSDPDAAPILRAARRELARLCVPPPPGLSLP